jgi:hypothetical protein
MEGRGVKRGLNPEKDRASEWCLPASFLLSASRHSADRRALNPETDRASEWCLPASFLLSASHHSADRRGA